MFGSFFDPFGYVNGYGARPQTQAYRRPGRQQRGYLDDFDPFGSPYPFRPVDNRYRTRGSYDESSSDSDGYDARQRQRQLQLEREREAREAQARREEELREEAAAEETRLAEERAREKARRREISQKRRMAQLERARKQEEIRRRQAQELQNAAREAGAAAGQSKAKEGEEQRAAGAATGTAAATAAAAGFQKAPDAIVPHTLLKSTKSYIVAANIPGYPADAVQILATREKITITLHHVHLTLPDAVPVEGYPALEAIVCRSPDNTLDIRMPSPISVDDADATLSGGRLLINLPFETPEDAARAKAEAEQETASATAAREERGKEVAPDAEDWTSLLGGLGEAAASREAPGHAATLVPVTML